MSDVVLNILTYLKILKNLTETKL